MNDCGPTHRHPAACLFKRLFGGVRGGVRLSGFSLIELLVVVAVVAVLCAMLLPALSRSAVTARQVRCGSNLRQLGIATQLYWHDNGGRSFPYRAGSTNNGVVYWFGWIENGPESTRAFDPSFGALYAYLRGRGIELCPAFSYTRASFKYKAQGAAYGYGYNLHLAGIAGQLPDQINRPAGLVLHADAAQVNTFQAPASAEHPMIEEFYYVNATERTAHFRHRQKANAVFADGHVAGEKPESLDERLPKEWVGRLRSEVLLP